MDLRTVSPARALPELKQALPDLDRAIADQLRQSSIPGSALEPIERAPALRFRESRIVLIGGGDPFPHEGINMFFRWAGGKDGAVLVLNWGGVDEHEYFEKFEHKVAGCEVGKIIEGPTRTDLKHSPDSLYRALDGCTGIFFTGGFQGRIMEQFHRYRGLRQVMDDLLQRGIAVGGTSSGTAIASEIMIRGSWKDADDFDRMAGNALITGDRDNPDIPPLGRGLGFLMPGTVIDQHYFLRERQPRLMAVLRHTDSTFGIGIDEGAALLFDGPGNVYRATGGKVHLLYRDPEDRIHGMVLESGDAVQECVQELVSSVGARRMRDLVW